MSVVDSVKRAPRWAWITAGGVGIGAAAVKLYRDRAVPPATDTVGTTVDGGAAPVGTAASPIGGYPGVVVPPVVIGSTSQDANQGVGVLQDLYVGAIADVVNGWGSLVQQLVGAQSEQVNTLQTQQGGLLGTTVSTLSSIAQAGGAPGQAIQNPAPIVVNVPVPQAAPKPIAQAAAPVAMTDAQKCGALGMLWNPANGPASGKSCYKPRNRTDCYQGRRRSLYEHVYGDGHVVLASVPQTIGKC